MISDEAKVVETWAEFFAQTCNGHTSDDVNKAEDLFYSVEQYIQNPTLKEVEKAVTQLENNKAPG